MNRWTCLLLLAPALSAAADRPDQPLDFAPRLVAALNAKKLAPRKALLHPKTLACITAVSRPLIDESLTAQFRYNIPTDYKSRAEALASDGPLKVGDGVVFPVRPTHQIQLDWKSGPAANVSFVVQVAYADGAWREVWPCISDDKVPAIRAANEARLQRGQRAQALAANLQPALRAELQDLIAKGRKVDAIKRYQDVSKEDLTTSRMVVDLVPPK